MRQLVLVRHTHNFSRLSVHPNFLLANDTRYGLGATIFSENVERAEKLAKKIDSGIVYINSVVVSDSRLPYGGVKDSGFGRECGAESIREFANIKSISAIKPEIAHA